jgi:hypothetical protein
MYLTRVFEFSGHFRMDERDLHGRVHGHVLHQLPAGQLKGDGQKIVIPFLQFEQKAGIC